MPTTFGRLRLGHNFKFERSHFLKLRGQSLLNYYVERSVNGLRLWWGVDNCVSESSCALRYCLWDQHGPTGPLSSPKILTTRPIRLQKLLHAWLLGWLLRFRVLKSGSRIRKNKANGLLSSESVDPIEVGSCSSSHEKNARWKST
jgi:hypothetical protein